MVDRVKFRIDNLKHRFIVWFFNSFQRTKQMRVLENKLLKETPNADFLRGNSNTERSVEINHEDLTLKEVLFSCYFINKENPQTGEVQGIADFNYIQKWYESVVDVELNAIIIHDGIDQDFISKYTTARIKFRKFIPGSHPLIDERWIIFYIFLKATQIEKAFFTDIGDVVITKNPFHLISSKNQFFIGRDNAKKIRLSGWILKEISQFQDESKVKLPKSFFYQSLYNVGILGGNRKVMLFMLSRYIDSLLITNSKTYKEMTIFNILVHEHFFPKLTYDPNESVVVNPNIDSSATHEYLISGYPLNSAFKGFENDSKAYFIHK